MRYFFYLFLLLALTGLGLSGCEKISFPEESTEKGDTGLSEDTLQVDSTGEGSMYAPATVKDLLRRESDFMGFSCWVAGYIVGYTERTMSNASFGTVGAVQSNILLADDPGCEDEEECVPVELKTEKWKQKLSLAHCPSNLGKRIAIHGLIKTYFSVIGIRSMDEFRWLAEEDSGTQPDDPEEEDRPDVPEDPDEPQENPDEGDDGNSGEPYLIQMNNVRLQWVDRKSVLLPGEHYMIGTFPELGEAAFIAASMKYGFSQKYRSIIKVKANGNSWVTEDGRAPAVFTLEKTDEGYCLRDELSGAYLAYDLRGDASSTSWLSLYTLLPEELNERYQSVFSIQVNTLEEQLLTVGKIKFSDIDSRNCLLRYNSGGNNFKLTYGKSGVPVYLFLLK